MSSGAGASKVAIVGTFDVRNYGDLLFPIVAQHELGLRLGDVDVMPFAYHAQSEADWPYRVWSLADLPDHLDDLSAILIGGGFLVRFDKDVAPGYGPPNTSIHHPTGYWLTPGLMALMCGIPLVWNGPGMHENKIPRWAEPLVRETLDSAAYVAVRDEGTRSALQAVAPAATIRVIPDTVFGLDAVMTRDPARSADCEQVLSDAGVVRPYMVVQSTTVGMDRVVSAVGSDQGAFGDLDMVAMQIGPVLGDQARNLTSRAPAFRAVEKWPDPLVLAEVIRGSRGVIGPSYHLAVTALTGGRPVVTTASLSEGKYAALADTRGLVELPRDRPLTREWLEVALATEPDPRALAERYERLTRHWDEVAAVVTGGRRATAPGMARLLQQLPSMLEGRNRVVPTRHGVHAVGRAGQALRRRLGGAGT